jgi:hypothetical protein
MVRRPAPTVKRPRKPACLDLFGEVPVTRQDVYAWLLAVVSLDPSSERAASYVHSYAVLNKIVRAKLDGTFDELTAPAKHSARYRELAAAGRATPFAQNVLGIGDWDESEIGSPISKALRAKRRPTEVIQQERVAKARRRELSQERKTSMLRRLPDSVPPLPLLLSDIGNPSPGLLAETFSVSVGTVQRWISNQEAPKAVLLALFWITKWGVSLVDSRAHNDAVVAVGMASALQAEAETLRSKLQRVGGIADFGSANDPLPEVAATTPKPARELPIVITSIRRAPCADSGRKKKSA